MEGIVVGIAQINFHQNLSGIADENSAPNFFRESPSSMSVSSNFFPNTEELATTDCDQVVDIGTFNRLSETEAMRGDGGWEEVDDEEGEVRIKKGYTLAERRQMPSRASKESSLLGIKRRTIMKPTKRTKTSEDFQNLKPADIRKIYLNKKLTNFKPSSLETIFEESSTVQNNEQDYLQRLMGARKIKRSLSCTDGFRYSKTLVNKRRAKIKKTFGKRFALKKISLEEFISKLNSSIDESDDNNVNISALGQEKREDIMGLVIPASSSCTEIFASNISTNPYDDAMMPTSTSSEASSCN